VSARLASQAHPSASARTLPKAIALSHELRDVADPCLHIAFAWLRLRSMQRRATLVTAFWKQAELF
jgi:hypothetical protein